MSRLSRITAVVGFIVLLIAGYVWVSSRQQPPLLVPSTVFEFEPMPPGEYEFTVTITNPASVPRRIIGVGDG